MRFHDFHLDKYEVSNFGENIGFHLIFDYPGQKREESFITFSEVALYHFIHVSPTIILDIVEISIAEIINEWGAKISEWNRMHGVSLWADTLENYCNRLQSEGYKAWRIESSIGFYGFVIAKRVSNA
ncbi:MAG: hypothetical protein P8X63_00765 [Desulfuromonadaceae bacterium]|jgi:hypothetical protein